MQEEVTDYLSIPQAAAYLSVHRSAIYQAIQVGHLVPVRVIGKSALRRADLDAYREREGRNRIRAKERNRDED